MSETSWFNNLPGVIMTEHDISCGVARVHENSKRVEIENWSKDNPYLMELYREDAELLRYLADCLESFDVARPVEADDESEQTNEEEAPIFGTPAEVREAVKVMNTKPTQQPLVAVNGSPAPKSMQDWASK